MTLVCFYHAEKVVYEVKVRARLGLSDNDDDDDERDVIGMIVCEQGRNRFLRALDVTDATCITLWREGFRVTGECDHFHTLVLPRSFSVVHTIHNHAIFGSARTRCGWILVCPPGVQAVSFLHDDVSDVGFRVSDSSQCESSRWWDHSCRLTCRSLSLLEIPVVVLYFRERLRSRSWHSVTRYGRMKLVVTTMVLCLWSPSETSVRESSFWIQVFEGRAAGGLRVHEAGTHYVVDKITDSEHCGGELETDYWLVELNMTYASFIEVWNPKDDDLIIHDDRFTSTSSMSYPTTVT